MRLLLVAPVFPPYRVAAALRTYTFARVWAEHGYEVTVLSTEKRANQAGQPMPLQGFRVVEIPYRGPWLLERLRGAEHDERAPATEAPRSWRRRVLQPLRTIKARLGVFSAVRQPDLTDFWQRPAFAWVRGQAPWDIVVSSGGPPAAHLLARIIKARGYARWWAADFRDLWLDNPIYTGVFPYTLLERRRERRVLHEADLLTTVSPGLARRLRQKAPAPVAVIYNGYDPATFAALPEEPFFPPDGQHRLVYTGTVYKHGRDPSPLLAALAREPRWRLVVAGDQGAWWAQLARQYGVADRVDFRGQVPRVEALRMQRDATALVHLDFPDPRQGVLSGKIFEYLQAPAPVLVIGGALQAPPLELLTQAGRGIGLGRDPERIASALRWLIDEPTRLNLVPNPAVIAELNRDEQSKRFMQLFPVP